MTSTSMRPCEERTTAQGTAEAARLFEEYSDRILAYCLCRLGSRSEAEDAVQTTFLYALRALRTGAEPELECAWLHAIARNVCRWQRRTLARRGTLTSEVDLDAVRVARPDGDEDGRLAGLGDALASIPELQRRALVLREWHGVPPREIAVELGLSGPATHALLTRARRSLVRALTLPRRPVAGLAWLAIELRGQVKALLGGASTKAAVAAVAVGAAGVAIEVGTGTEPGARTTPVVVEKHLEGSASVVEQPSAPRPARAAPPTRPRDPPADQLPVPAVVERQGEEPASSPAPTLPTRTGYPVAETQPSSDPGPSVPGLPDLPSDLPLEPPPLPELGSPTDLLPPVDLPPLPAPPPVPPVDESLPRPPPLPDVPQSGPPLP